MWKLKIRSPPPPPQSLFLSLFVFVAVYGFPELLLQSLYLCHVKPLKFLLGYLSGQLMNRQRFSCMLRTNSLSGFAGDLCACDGAFLQCPDMHFTTPPQCSLPASAELQGQPEPKAEGRIWSFLGMCTALCVRAAFSIPRNMPCLF